MLRNQYTPPLQSSEIGKPNIDSSKNKNCFIIKKSSSF